MKKINQLFDQFLKNKLDESGISEMNRLLINAWFDAPERLPSEKLEYAEDLVIELFNANQLEEHHAEIFRERMMLFSELSEKVKLYGKIGDFFASPKVKITHDPEMDLQPGDPEERQLQEIVREMIRSSEKPERKIFVWLKPTLSIAALFLICLAGWYLFKPGQSEVKEMAKTKPSEPPKQEIQATAKENKSQNINRIPQALIHYFKPEKLFDYMALRSESVTNADEMFILAADCYNRKHYDSSLLILNKLTILHSFHDKDTLNEIHYFSGNCNMIKGWPSVDTLILKKALRSFSQISPDHRFYASARWYSALAYIRLGQTEAGRKILDTPLSKNYEMKMDVQSLRNLIKR